MSFSSLLGVELKKLRRSKILIILIAPIFLIWIMAIINVDLNFHMSAEGMSPENNFFIQSFLGFAYFMLPSSIVIMTVLITQTERANKGILKMLSLPISSVKLCLAKFCTLLFLIATEILLAFITYFPAAIVASKKSDYDFMLSPLYVLKISAILFLMSIPMTAVYWLISVLIKNPVASVGIGLASVVPIVFAINSKAWFAYTMCYPMMTITSEMHKLATKMGTFTFDWIPFVPVAILITLASIIISCIRFGKSERK